jgi:RecA-family ATPase
MQQGGASRAIRSVPEQIDDYERKQAQRELEQWVQIDDLGIIDFDLFSEDRLPQLEWMVENHFLKGTVALVAGDGGIGKSTLMQHLATCCVMGAPWLGFHVEKGAALMLACEDDLVPLLHRHRAIVRHIGVGWDEPKLNGLQIWPRVGQDNSMMYLDRPTWQMAPTHLFERVALRCRRQGIKYLIVDTATQTFRGNQNDETQVMDYISAWRRVAIAMEGVVVITKHPSLSGRALGTGESGNTAWTNSVRSRFYLHRDKQKNLLWKGMKQNYSSNVDEIPLRYQSGVFVLDKPENDADAYYKR